MKTRKPLSSRCNHYSQKLATATILKHNLVQFNKRSSTGHFMIFRYHFPMKRTVYCTNLNNAILKVYCTTFCSILRICTIFHYIATQWTNCTLLHCTETNLPCNAPQLHTVSYCGALIRLRQKAHRSKQARLDLKPIQLLKWPALSLLTLVWNSAKFCHPLHPRPYPHGALIFQS